MTAEPGRIFFLVERESAINAGLKKLLILMSRGATQIVRVLDEYYLFSREEDPEWIAEWEEADVPIVAIATETSSLESVIHRGKEG